MSDICYNFVEFDLNFCKMDAKIDTDDKIIEIRNLRENNLKNISLNIPRNKFIVITGVSGSGKSSLAFDTLFSEGRRRYVESLSSYARQFLGRIKKPDCDYIKGIPPSVAIEQRIVTRNPRSNVATTTEIYEYLKLMYARIGKIFSPLSGEEIKKHTTSDVVNFLSSLDNKYNIYITAPVNLQSGSRVEEYLEMRLKQGYHRIFYNGRLYRIEDVLNDEDIVNDHNNIHILYYRLSVNDQLEENLSGVMDSIDLAFFEGGGYCYVHLENKSDREIVTKEFSNVFGDGDLVFEELTPEMFSFNNAVGACPKCEGYGMVIGLDPDLIIPNKNLSLYEDCVAAWKGTISSQWKNYFIRHSSTFDFPIHTPYNELSDFFKNMLWNGIEVDGENIGINSYFEMLRRDSHKIQNRVRLSHFRGKTLCPECSGKRLKKTSLLVKVDGKNIDDVVKMPISEALNHFVNIHIDERDRIISERLLKEIINRLEILCDLGLHYITLDRQMSTLSGGESQRITLSTQIGNNLVGSLYVLDEPSIGLHQSDTEKLISVIRKLRDLGNTVTVVEHDREIMMAADYIIDIGPKAGSMGGNVVFSGNIKDIDKATEGITAKFLNNELCIETPEKRRPCKEYMEFGNVFGNNLKGDNIRIPLGGFVVIAGVSGSGKSTFVKKVLKPSLERYTSNEESYNVGCRDFYCSVVNKKLELEFVDQNTISINSRSNPCIYIGAYEYIRNLFASLPVSKQMGYKPYFFSFNKEGGRCENCKGDGYINVEMQFMADVRIKCSECNGKRFQKDILDVRFHEKNIHEILLMTVKDAISFFSEYKDESKDIVNIINALNQLDAVGLGYIQLGQSSSTLSGGENQRLKLASYIKQKNDSSHTVYVFDEPTTGLHFYDIKILLDAFNELIAKGNTIIVIEHNIDVIKCADWIIELGPNGGEKGGHLIAEGTPEEIVVKYDTPTTRILKEYL